MKKNNTSAAGFTLIEVAIVFVIGGLIIGSAATMLNNYMKATRIAVTQSRMQDIDKALQQYLSINGVLPCPARLTDKPDTATFGISITDGITPTPDCSIKAGGTAGTFTVSAPAPQASAPPHTNVVIGAIPARSLNLPDQMMLDAWGNRFVYAVTDLLTVSGRYDPALGTVALTDGNNNPLVGPTFNPPSYAQYVVISQGMDGAGAYSLEGAQPQNCPAAPALQHANCTFTKAAFRKSILFGTQKGNNYFDDYVIFRSQQTSANNPIPSGLISPFAAVSCPNGWKSLGSSGPCTATAKACCQKL